MAITTPPKSVTRRPTPEEFIGGAPDSRRNTSEAEKAAGGKNGTQRGKRTMATIGFQEGVLDRATRAAEEFGISRAAWINRAVKKALDDAGY